MIDLNERQSALVPLSVCLVAILSALSPAQAQSVSPPWANGDIGAPATPGGAGQSGATFTVRGAGADIWGNRDQFHFVYQAFEGDLDVRARVVDLEPVSAWTKAGVMIREELEPRARYAMTFITPSNGAAFQWRFASGGRSSRTEGPPGAPPVWVRLARAGRVFSSYVSADGVNWELVGSQTVDMRRSVYVGLAVTSRTARRTATAVFSDVSVLAVGGGDGDTAGRNRAPTVTLAAPADRSTFPAPASVSMVATAADADGAIARVDFFANSQRVGSDATSPYEMTWSGVPAGTYTLTALATDNAGATATSGAATISVTAPANLPPTAAVTSPANGATVTAPVNLTITAAAADTDGTIVRVDFYSGTQSIGSDTASPYTIVWSNVPAGTHPLVAVARDDDGASTASAAVTVTVNAAMPAPAPATVAFTASPDHATAVTSYSAALYRVADPVTATPAATKNLGKPAPTNGEIAVDIADIVNPLPAGWYYAVVTAIGPGGSAASAPSLPFAR